MIGCVAEHNVTAGSVTERVSEALQETLHSLKSRCGASGPDSTQWSLGTCTRSDKFLGLAYVQTWSGGWEPPAYPHACRHWHRWLLSSSLTSARRRKESLSHDSAAAGTKGS